MTSGFTDYTQSSLKNEKIKNEYGIKTNESYRAFLVKHAETIMQRNYHEMTTSVVRDETPYLFLGVHDDSKPKGYSESDLKDTYLTREKLNALRKRQFVI